MKETIKVTASLELGFRIQQKDLEEYLRNLERQIKRYIYQTMKGSQIYDINHKAV